MRVRVLGSAAGGGFPQWNCSCAGCRAAREGTATPRTQSSIAVESGERWFLVNASPDVRQQMTSCPGLHPRDGRATPLEAVLLTDAEIDHTLGLLLLREGRGVTVHATAATEATLRRGTGFLTTLERYCPVRGRPGGARRRGRPHRGPLLHRDRPPDGQGAPLRGGQGQGERSDGGTEGRPGPRHRLPLPPTAAPAASSCTRPASPTSSRPCSPPATARRPCWSTARLPRRRARPAQGLGTQAARPTWATCPSQGAGTARAPGGLAGAAHRPRAHQQLEPDPARGLARAGRRRAGRGRDRDRRTGVPRRD